MLPSLTPSHWLSLHGLITVTGLLVYVVVSHVLEDWCRMPGDLVFMVFGLAPIAIAAVRAHVMGRKASLTAGVS